MHFKITQKLIFSWDISRFTTQVHCIASVFSSLFHVRSWSYGFSRIWKGFCLAPSGVVRSFFTI